MKYIKLICLIGMFFNQCTAQQISPKDLFGKWKVKNWIFLQHTGETMGEYQSRMEDIHKCLHSIIILDTSGIRGSCPNICYLDPCHNNFSINPIFLHKKIIPDNDYTRESEGAEMIDSNIIGKRFVQLLDKYYTKPFLTLLDTKCKDGNGDFTLKICIINKNLIGLYSGVDLIVLERR